MVEISTSTSTDLDEDSSDIQSQYDDDSSDNISKLRKSVSAKSDVSKNINVKFSLSKEPKEIQLTKAMAIKGISNVTMSRKEQANIENYLGKVVSLHLQKKGIQFMVPDGLEGFHSLSHLYLYDNKIQKIDGLLCLSQLESLHLSGNQISRIENLDNCVNLRRLYLGNNKIEVVEGLETLSMLVELHIEHQKLPPEQPLIFCPNSLDTISRKLKVLNINGNQLESIEDLICMNVLDTLNASKNKISELDNVTEILQSLRQLRVVDLRENPITKIPRYKESIIGHLNYIEVLDTKDVNEMQKRSLQRLCSIKAARLRQEMNKKAMSPTNVGQSLNQGIASAQNIIKSISAFSEPQSSQFQFSTPISRSPIPDQEFSNSISVFENVQARDEMFSGGDFQQYENRDFLNFKASNRDVFKPRYASRTMNGLQEDNDSESMSEMAKIIFRLSNLSPSPNDPKEALSKPKETSYWKRYLSGGSSAIKESRPLSPLELDVTNSKSNSSTRALGSRKSAPLRRPMVRKLPYSRHSIGAGRTLSPLQELPTPGPDSLTRDGMIQPPEWIGQSFQTSGCSLPPLPINNNRKKALYPSKVTFSQ